MSFSQLLGDFVRGYQFGQAHGNVRSFLEQDREVSCQQITHNVENMSPAELDQFEELYLTHAIAVFGNAHRLRALELYAWLKMEETRQYGKFRGFLSTSDALST